jgi:hypothetical protein
MKHSLFLVCSLIPLLSGCYYNQPADVGQGSAINGTTLAMTGAGAVGGAFAGNAIDSGGVGAAVGAGAGALVVGGATALIQNRQQKELAEAYEAGKKEAMAKVYQDWWSDNAVFSDPLADANKKGPKTRQIQLPAGTYESVPYDNRSYEAIVSPNNQ